jgi:hypothetical protein
MGHLLTCERKVFFLPKNNYFEYLWANKRRIIIEHLHKENFRNILVYIAKQELEPHHFAGSLAVKQRS